MQLNLNESDKNYLITEIENKYLPHQDDLKNIFLMNEEIFGNNFYIQLENEHDNFKTRIIYLVKELIDTEKLNNFLEIIRHKYPLFANQIKSPKLELIQILNDGFEDNREIFLTAYRSSMPKRTVLKQNPKDATELISWLTIPPQQQEYTCIEKFVGYLLKIEQTRNFQCRDKLTLWAETWIQNNNELQRLIEEENNIPREAHLLIELRSKGKNYVVKASLMKDIDEDKVNKSDHVQLKVKNKDEITIKENLTNFPENIKKFISQACNELDKTQDFRQRPCLKRIHIFLPYQLMDHRVHCYNLYESNSDLHPLKIGEEYEIVIRFSERTQNSAKNEDNIPILRQKWFEKGQKCFDKLKQPATDIFISTHSITNLLSEINDNNVIGVKIISSLHPGVDLYQTGIPLALWICDLHNPNIENELNNLFKIDNRDILLKELPSQVKIRRQKNTAISENLCLLWDVPNVLPPPKQSLTDTKI